MTTTLAQCLHSADLPSLSVDKVDIFSLPQHELEKISAFELRKEAASRIPVPPSVMHDELHNFEPEELYMTLKNGVYGHNIFANVELRMKERKIVEEFRAWTVEQGLVVPPGFCDENYQDLRILQCSDYDFQSTYDKILMHDREIREGVVPLLLDFENYVHLFEEGWYYGYGRDR